jgi:hypothetical protein
MQPCASIDWLAVAVFVLNHTSDLGFSLHNVAHGCTQQNMYRLLVAATNIAVVTLLLGLQVYAGVLSP